MFTLELPLIDEVILSDKYLQLRQNEVYSTIKMVQSRPLLAFSGEELDKNKTGHLENHCYFHCIRIQERNIIITNKVYNAVFEFNIMNY